MASTEKEDSRRRGVWDVLGPAERRWTEGDRGAGEQPGRGGCTPAPTGLGMVRPWPGRVALEASEKTVQKEARTRPNSRRGLLKLAGRKRAGRAGLFFLQPSPRPPEACELPTSEAALPSWASQRTHIAKERTHLHSSSLKNAHAVAVAVPRW